MASSVPVVGDCRAHPSDTARNIGVVFDQNLSLDKHVNSIGKSVLFHLRNIVKVKEYLTFKSTKALVHAFVTRRLDNCNSLLTGSPTCLIIKLQRIQNCAARLVVQQRRVAHQSPILKALHWLPVDMQIVFKVLLLTYKAINNLAPSYITQLLVRYNQPRSLRQGTSEILRR